MNFFEHKNNSQSLTEKVMAYKATGNGFRTIQDTICLLIYEYSHKWTNWDEDTQSDFLLFFHPRIKSMVENYMPDFRFETYLMSSIRWGIINFSEREQCRKYEISWIIEELEKQCSENQNRGNDDFRNIKQKLPFKLDKEGRIADFTTRRRLICAIMLTIAEMQTESIPDIAYMIGVKSDWLHGKMVQIKRMIDEKIHKRQKLIHRVNECWFKMDSARAMSKKASTENRRSMWDKRFKTWSRRYLLASDSIREIKVKPSHAEIGKILNLPAGTVSSHIHYLRKKLKKSGMKWIGKRDKEPAKEET